jgi:hypothetical protein
MVSLSVDMAPSDGTTAAPTREKCRYASLSANGPGHDHDGDPREHDTDLGDQSADLRGLDAPIFAVTMARYAHVCPHLTYPGTHRPSWTTLESGPPRGVPDGPHSQEFRVSVRPFTPSDDRARMPLSQRISRVMSRPERAIFSAVIVARMYHKARRLPSHGAAKKNVGHYFERRFVRRSSGGD